VTTAYIDASALVKLVVAEPESDALRASLEAVDLRVTSIVGRIELERAARKHDDDGIEARVASTLAPIDILPLHAANAALAGVVAPTTLRTMDAIHLATLLEISDDVDRFYCYDQRLADAASEHGITVVAPA
jgi:predicted nucleic acid-binding protein